MRRARDLPLSEYAIIGDRRTAALVARDGGIDWLCHGRFDGPAVFCRLLDWAQGGYLQVSPRGRFAANRGYIGASNVLATEFESSAGTARVTDCMPLAAEGAASGPVVLRKLEGLAGCVELALELRPTFDFARARAQISISQDGCRAEASGAELRLSCPGSMALEDGAATSTFALRAGETRWIVLTHGAPPFTAQEAERALQGTLQAWERWSGHGEYAGPYADAVRRSALVLRLLSHEPTGGTIAAPTTSLPESPGGVRNWDYRYTWLRDASWVVSALMDLGYHDESMAFIAWLERLDLGRAAKPSVFYDLDGAVPIDEEELEHLRGYCGARPVRIGNLASEQDQHDVFGEVVAAIHMCSERMPSMRPLRAGLWRLVVALADKAASHWAHVDHGIWEQREPRQHFLSSKLLCWVALDRALEMAARDGLAGPTARWEIERERICQALLGEGFNERVGAFTRVLGGDDLDATALLLPRYGFLPASDARMRASVERVTAGLSDGGFIRRYRVEDGFPGTEGAFVACSFWLVDCLARENRLEEAYEAFERVMGRASDLGLLSEELWPRTGELLGNYPQAFSHLALIRAATSITQAEQRTRPLARRP